MSQIPDQPYLYDATHQAQAVADLLSQYQSAPRLVAVARAMGAADQLLEDVAWQVLQGTRISVAVDDALDQWGETVSVPRNGLNDTDYRRMILAQIPALRNRGSIPEWMSIVAVALNIDKSQIAIYSRPPASLIIYVNHGMLLDATNVSALQRLLNTATPGGIRLMFVEAVGGAFRFGSPTLGIGVGLFSRAIL